MTIEKSFSNTVKPAVSAIVRATGKIAVWYGEALDRDTRPVVEFVLYGGKPIDKANAVEGVPLPPTNLTEAVEASVVEV